MTKFIGGVKRFIQSEDAPTMVEYGLVVALIALIVAAGASILGANVKSVFTAVGRSI
jgi:pilus assembly protein Flp/PilA